MRMKILPLFAFLMILTISSKAQHDVKWSNGFKVESADKKFKLKFGGRLMYDLAFIAVSDSTGSLGDYEYLSEFRRARFFSSGTIYGNVKYKVQLDFAGKVSFKDVWLELTKIPGMPTDIIHLGAGGSALGPKLLYTALGHLLPKSSEVYKVHFISNIDGHEIVKATKTLNPASTLVIVNSKSFTTIETLENLKYLKKWKKGKDGEQDYIAITAYPQKALENGIPKGQILSYPLWLGGRYSIFSPVGFILPALFGKKYYLEFLKGAHNHDRHTQKEQAINKSPSVRSALFDYLYHQIIGMPTRTVLIYDSRLELLLSYLQQLEMESNSKSISVDNKKINYSTAPIIWGGVGTDCQHSIFQSLFQGTHTFPSEFITVKKPNHRLTNHHKWLLANARAQQLALRSGYTDKNNSAKNCKGNKPSTHIQLDELTPRALGGLISFYELRVFLYGKLLNINSFDQMGVEFSKPIAKNIYKEQSLSL